jgi:D-psicose/D-tagatose/L-ribulose 3-epimerase
MRFGICIPIERAGEAAAGGWEFIEEVVTRFLDASIPDSDWHGVEQANQCPLPLIAANRLVPATIKITGPDANRDVLRNYLQTIITRAGKVGIKFLVFGSGPARRVPEGFDRSRARDQMLDFIRMAMPFCSDNGVTLVAEHLYQKETNIMNSLAEAMEYVKAVNHPNFQCLVDSHHFWAEKEPMRDFEAAMPWIKHVHVSDVIGRGAPGETNDHDYRSFFAGLHRGGYDAAVTVESDDNVHFSDWSKRCLAFLKRENAAAKLG